MDTKTKEFLKKIDYLIERGIVKNTQEVIDTLNWNKSVMSAVRNDKLPVPQHIYIKFKETYAAELNGSINEGATSEDDYKDKYIALLERQLKEKDERIEYLLTHINSSFAAVKQHLNINSAYVKVLYQVTQLHRASTEKEPAKKESLKKIQDETGRLYAEALAEFS